MNSFWIILLIFNFAFVWSIAEIYLDNNSSTEKQREMNEFYSNIYNNSFPRTIDFSVVGNHSSSFNIDSKVGKASENNSGNNTSAPITPITYRTISGATTEIPYTKASVSVVQTPISPLLIHEISSPDKVSLAVTPLSHQLPNKIKSPKYSPRISEIKCHEYARKIKMITRKQIKRNLQRRSIIVSGGHRVELQLIHTVALGIRDSNGTFILMCGGSLIAPTWVLTAAHCTHGSNPTDIRIGTRNLANNTSGITASIKRIIRHSDYKPPALYADIALIKLNTSITFDNTTGPVCLYPKYNPRHRDCKCRGLNGCKCSRKMTINGWGSKEYDGEFSKCLQEANVDLIENSICTVRLNTSKEIPRGITSDMICAGDPRGNWTRDTCQGDSGGPLQINHQTYEFLFQVVGITSFGWGCALYNNPGVYTRVFSYLSWIENIVWP